MPQTFVDVVELLIPELRKRGVFWDDYAVPGGTYRENVYEKEGQAAPPHDHPAAAMIWRAPATDGHTASRGNGFANGHLEDEEILVDPQSMQLG